MSVVHLVIGPAEHGVTRHALEMTHASASAHHHVRRLETAGDVEAARRFLADVPEADLVHLHLTDHLLAPTAGECAALVRELADRRRLSLTLHDLPQPADGPGRFERRRAAYAAMAHASAGVVVASDHERSLLESALAAEGFADVPIAVIPLPMTIGAPVVPPAGADRRVVVFGFLYPGKGHLDALRALADAPSDVGFTALGQVSAGHADLVAELYATGEDLGRDVEITGWVPEPEVATRLRTAAVPVAPHRHVSASGSVNSWLAAGRRPLVPAGSYIDELDARIPGAVLRYGPGGRPELPDLATAIRAALEDPTLTAVAVDPAADVADIPATAARLAAVLDGWASA